MGQSRMLGFRSRRTYRERKAPQDPGFEPAAESFRRKSIRSRDQIFVESFVFHSLLLSSPSQCSAQPITQGEDRGVSWPSLDCCPVNALASKGVASGAGAGRQAGRHAGRSLPKRSVLLPVAYIKGMKQAACRPHGAGPALSGLLLM